MTERELTAADYMAMLRRRWVLIVVLAAIGGPLAYGIARILPAKYKSQTLVLVQPPAVSDIYVRPLETIDPSERLASMKQQILSRTRLEPIIRQYGLYSADVNRVSMDTLVERLQDAVDVTPVQPMAEVRANNLPGFYVNVTLNDPRMAQQICTAITSMFIEESIRGSQQRSEMTTDFLGQQLDEAKKNLDDQDSKLAAFKSRYVQQLPDEEQTNLNLLTGLTSQLDAATQALARAQQDKSFAESLLTQQIGAWQESQSATGASPDTLEQQLAILQTQLTNLQARYTDDYPDVIKTKHDIALLQKRIADQGPDKPADPNKVRAGVVEPAQITQLRAQVHSFDEMIAEKSKEQERIKEEIKLYEARVQSSPVVEEQYKELTRGYQTALDSYNELLKKQTDAKMAVKLQQDSAGEQFSVLDPADLPTKPSFPNRPLFAAGGLGGGLALGLGLAFLMEMRDSSLKSERDVEFALRLPVLAVVPSIQPTSSKRPPRPSGQIPRDSNLGLGARA
ncbi:MAG TPA: Wzz/FepE/Etk N-terminal domain-containing protein [Candidatus Baltobacteraceae bacterium]|nr:Wzz/FepE/Etk N-terminal domain-containing protein [Candidatus Baltobacteraceae bacterium]